MKKISLAIVLLCCCAEASPDEENKVYTLYRDSPYILKVEGPPKEGEYDYTRVHITTFDSTTNDPDFNRFHCERVKGFYENELKGYSAPLDPNGKFHSNFWCEKGRYKP